MPAPPTTKQKHDLERALGMTGEKEYCRLLRALRMARGSFFLFPIESDFPNVLRDALLERLRSDLAARGNCLRTLSLNRRQWDVFALPELESSITEADVVILVGLEETPGIISEVGAKPARPPALALLNQQRELLHQCVPAPFLVWCPPFVFTALIEQAPDFFDQYAGQFRFHNAAPDRTPVGRLPVLASEERRSLIALTPPAASQSAVTFYETQLAQHLEPTPERARALLGLAYSLLQMHEPNNSQNVKRILSVVEEALTLLSPEQDAYHWARGQILKGIVYAHLSIGDQAQNLLRAIYCYEAALRVTTEVDFPHAWAITQHNLGAAYSALLTGDRGANLQRAIAYYDAALRVHTETNFPEDWARTQNNLAVAYCTLPTGDKAQNLLHAIECFEAALRVFTQADFPYEWAKTQHNLGAAYDDLPTGDRTQNLHYAVECYEATLRVRTENQFPREWAETQFNLAFTQGMLGNWEAARLALHCAAAGFHQVGLEDEAKEAENALQRLAAK